MSQEQHASRAYLRQIAKTAKRAPTTRELEQYAEWERQGRIERQRAADESHEQE